MATNTLVHVGALALLASLLLLSAPASAATASTAHAAAYTCEQQTGPDPTLALLCYSTSYGRTCIVWIGSDSSGSTFCL